MKIQKRPNYDEWIDYMTVIDDSITGNKRIIPQNSYLDIGDIWNSQAVYIGDYGNYRISVSLLNEQGEVIITDNGNKIEDIYPFWIN